MTTICTMNRNNNINTTDSKNKISNKNKNKNKTNCTSSSRIQSASSDVFENSDMDINVTVNKSSKSGRNFSSSGEFSTSKIAKMTQKNDISEPAKPPPPIMIQGMLDFVALRNDFFKLLGAENFLFKSSTNDLKILTKNSDSYRAVIKYLNENKAEYHTYQQLRQVANVRHKTTKKKLTLFFVDLEINKEIFYVTSIFYTKVRIEEPHKRREVIQCQNCQKYGHSKSYCAHPPRCVRWAEFHTSSSCTKSTDQPPTCALCGGSHPANYRGCTVHKDLQKFHNNSKATTKQNVNLNYNVNGGKATSDGTLSGQPNLNLNNSKEFPNLSTNVSHPQDSKDKPNYYKKNH
ncbi:Pre-C2HC domain [Cinara cedri]|uniref:Pre-C2HC domain n=1 Tax=Cinara cedri TaxID=506608 RepID=A0A5E4NDS8_9HEMI|nr:Pre-C2HC domain [Cinara cedri]